MFRRLGSQLAVLLRPALVGNPGFPTKEVQSFCRSAGAGDRASRARQCQPEGSELHWKDQNCTGASLYHLIRKQYKTFMQLNCVQVNTLSGQVSL